jgi:hypothetical protein
MIWAGALWSGTRVALTLKRRQVNSENSSPVLVIRRVEMVRPSSDEKPAKSSAGGKLEASQKVYKRIISGTSFA